MIDALARVGLSLEKAHQAYRSPWRRTAIEEALDPEAEPALYTPSPRSTRGATRA
jgi:hypothetical protein